MITDHYCILCCISMVTASVHVLNSLLRVLLKNLSTIRLLYYLHGTLQNAKGRVAYA